MRNSGTPLDPAAADDPCVHAGGLKESERPDFRGALSA
jgi:hypothetical protein